MQYRIKKAASGKNKAKLDFKDGRLDDKMVRIIELKIFITLYYALLILDSLIDECFTKSFGDW
jgi:hypothetical protein